MQCTLCIWEKSIVKVFRENTSEVRGGKGGKE